MHTEYFIGCLHDVTNQISSQSTGTILLFKRFHQDEKSVDPDQLASLEVCWYHGSTRFSKWVKNYVMPKVHHLG